MKLYVAAIVLAGCYRAPITYAGGHVTPPQITCVYCDTLPKLMDDSSAVWMYKRLEEITDSIRLIKKQTAFLDSMGRSLDTVKWTPYYYKPKNKK